MNRYIVQVYCVSQVIKSTRLVAGDQSERLALLLHKQLPFTASLQVCLSASKEASIASS